MANATGTQTNVVVEYKIHPVDQRRLTVVTLIEDYSTTADIPKIIGIPLGLSSESVIVYGVWYAPTCEWFAHCDSPTAGGVEHPVLGAVPICTRCARKMDVQDKVQPLFLTNTYED